MTSNAQNPLTEEDAAIVAQLSTALAEAFKPGAPLAGRFGFALFVIPTERATSAMLSNVARPRVAEAIGGWMIANGFAEAVQIHVPKQKH